MKTPESIIKKIDSLKKGDKEAFSGIYEESYGYLHTCVIHIVRNEDTAQDMLQEAYAEIYRNIDQLKQPEDFLGWAATIANRKCFAYLKKDRELLLEDRTEDEESGTGFFETIPDDEAFIPENILDDREKVRMIREVIDDLSDVQRACVIGFYYNEQKQEEIASELGIPVNTVKSHLNRAKARLKDSIKDVEKKQGVKLCGMSPFMLLLFKNEAAAFAADGTIPALGSAVTAGSGTSAGTGAGVGTGVSAAGSLAGLPLKTKIIIGTAAALICIGAIAGGVLYHQSKKQEAPSVADASASVQTGSGEGIDIASGKEDPGRGDSDVTKSGAGEEASSGNSEEEVVTEPTEVPAAEPTETPAAEPTKTPAVEPTEAPAAEPTEVPAAEPTEAPAAEPTEAPAAEPTEAPNAGIITGSFDIDPVIDKYANASKISEINEIVAAGTGIYSSSGKTMIIYYNSAAGDFWGYDFIPETRISVGKHEVSTDTDNEAALIRNTGKWRMNVYPCTDGDGDLYVDFYAVP
ncbi:MAG: sigma-70 family RNA polymerase sigma factor [Lachnospiraceae bacterium]|nr:sigma-70 family RNA polymerase sigma factor [Lachnospiraceae bacterium]